jgi:hypothetical protein
LDKIIYYLVDEAAGKAFLRLIQLEEWSESIKTLRTNQGVRPDVTRGAPSFALTARGKYKNRITTLYRMAAQKSDSLLQAFKSLQKKGDLFNEELIRFQSRFNLMDILSFIKSIENLDDLKGVLGENTDYRAIPALEKTMVLKPFRLSLENAPIMMALPPLKEIQKSLDKLINQYFQKQCSEINKRLRDG